MKKYSKFLSYVLRHRPDEIGIELDESGWVEVETLLEAARERDQAWNLELLEKVVRENDKQRFELADERIRARQGHSIDVDLGYQPAKPPERLYHGTIARVLAAIREGGLEKMARHHVHLSPDIETASKVGGRRGMPVILNVDARSMQQVGFTFYVTENDVWLVDHVPPEYIEFPDT